MHTIPMLYSEHFAPWSERARWAMDHHRLRYSLVEHTPLLGDLRLRAAARKATGAVSVPLLVDGPVRLMDSVAIAHYADSKGSMPRLLPAATADEVLAWCSRIEPLMQLGRARVLAGLKTGSASILEAAPVRTPDWLHPVVAAVGSLAVRRLEKKYAATYEPAAALETARSVIRQLEAALRGRMFLVDDRFSFADIAVASALQFVQPVDSSFIALGPATRIVWTWPGLAEESASVIAWRDTLYHRHRALPSPVADVDR